jgi:hypothetical protein
MSAKNGCEGEGKDGMNRMIKEVSEADVRTWVIPA